MVQVEISIRILDLSGKRDNLPMTVVIETHPIASPKQPWSMLLASSKTSAFTEDESEGATDLRSATALTD